MKKNNINKEEYQTRCELAALYQILDLYNMSDIANQEVGARIKGQPNHYLIHQYGMLYEEITASSLVKINQDGNKINQDDPWINEGGANLAKWIFNARKDIHFFVHGHCEDVMAVGGTQEGLMLLSQAAIYLSHLIGYVDYEFVEDEEYGNKFTQLAEKNNIIITRNHGYYTFGKTAAEAFFRAYYLKQACCVQIKNLSMKLTAKPINPQKAAYFWQHMRQSEDYNYDGKTEWNGLLRKLDRKNSNYRH